MCRRRWPSPAPPSRKAPPRRWVRRAHARGTNRCPRAPSRTESSRPGTCATRGPPRSEPRVIWGTSSTTNYTEPRGFLHRRRSLALFGPNIVPPRGAVLVLPRLADHDPGLQLTDKPLAGHALRLLVLDAQTGALRLLPAGDRRRAVIPHVPGLSRRPVDRPWEPEAAPDVSPALMQRLQPWRSRS